MKKRKALACLLALGILAGAAGCGQSAQNGDTAAEDTQSAETDAAETAETETAEADTDAAGTRLITDSEGREVEIPEKVESIVCLNVGALRYTCYMQAQDLVIGVEDYEKEQSISRGYNYVNFELFQDLPVVGNNGEHYPEEIISADPDVIVMSAYDDSDADSLQEKTGIPVVVVPGSDSMMDEGAYETFRVMGELYGREDRAQELIDYMDSIKEDLETRTADVAEEDKLTAYVAGVSYKGAHGFEGTEAGYGPFAAINAKNLADETGQTGPFDIDPEQVLAWDPDVIFVDFNGLDLVNEDYASNPEYYEQLTAVQEGRVYSQISFRSSASNLDTALADTYYAASVLYPEQFADVDPEEKAAEIFEMLLGENFYEDLKANGYEFRQITIGE
ncbi:iron ABC transporter substrate-binding protein [Lachnoclostridium sp. An131]|uniref:iron ABC transporter substrate-binding protein n=1 Tax=Lachnoclostridium sp. An131 TaxID=1965555 RepID=UPI000B3A8436|nr:iron ABC transporter substrate-binding protein [Lachnoclostridium sp. An131]OUQ23927.1 iron ABC transporter substrate-binding protein [Lachnoclostridium sp. An131]